MHNSWSRFGRGVPGDFFAIVVAADINNTASQRASFMGGGGDSGEGAVGTSRRGFWEISG